MKILVLGGAGMVGRKFIERLAKQRSLAGRDIESITAQDVVATSAPPACAGPNPPFAFTAIASDLATAGEAERLIASRPDLILHLAAIVSARRKLISRRATASISMERARSSRRSGRRT